MSAGLFTADGPAPVAEVVQLHPDGVVIRTEAREDGEDVYWIERRRGSRATAAVGYSLTELLDLRVKLRRLLGPEVAP
jgi:hypothetical protein